MQKCKNCQSLEQQLADCESDHRQQVDKAVELHNENKRLRGAMEKFGNINNWIQQEGDHQGDDPYWTWIGLDAPIEIAQQALSKED